MAEETLRAKLVKALVDLSGDEMETVQDGIDLAMLSKEELVDNLINVAMYYKKRI